MRFLSALFITSFLISFSFAQDEQEPVNPQDNTVRQDMTRVEFFVPPLAIKPGSIEKAVKNMKTTDDVYPVYRKDFRAQGGAVGPGGYSTPIADNTYVYTGERLIVLCNNDISSSDELLELINKDPKFEEGVMNVKRTSRKFNKGIVRVTWVGEKPGALQMREVHQLSYYIDTNKTVQENPVQKDYTLFLNGQVIDGSYTEFIK